MRMIDADALKSKVQAQEWKRDPAVMLALDWIYMLINEQPTIDAVPVVRCRECKSHGTLKSGELFCGKIKTGIYGYYHAVKADDYCSYGERKEDRK